MPPQVWGVLLDNTTNSYRLGQLDVDNTINTAIGYLQDDRGDLLYDHNGEILQAESLNAIAVPYQNFRFDGYCSNNGMTDASKYSKYGTVTFNKTRGKMGFSSNLSNREVVIRYVSDGLHASLSDRDIRVHKYLRATIENYIYWEGIRHNREVPANEKYRARQDYLTTLHESKVAMSDFNMTEIARMMRRRNMIL